MKFNYSFFPKTIHLRINWKKKKKNVNNVIEPIELKLQYWIFYAST
jgi:hypothetical protein